MQIGMRNKPHCQSENLMRLCFSKHHLHTAWHQEHVLFWGGGAESESMTVLWITIQQGRSNILWRMGPLGCWGAALHIQEGSGNVFQSWDMGSAREQAWAMLSA